FRVLRADAVLHANRASAARADQGDPVSVRMGRRSVQKLVGGLLAVGLFAALPALAQHEPKLDPANNNIANTASLQRGAKYFVNYCFGCHSAKYVRYNRLGQDLQLTEDQLVTNLMFTGDQVHDTMEIAMRPEDAERWFGGAPPDLSLIARARGTDYIYTFL